MREVLKMSLLKHLTDQWNLLMKEHHEETLLTYNMSVEKGNEETFEEFKAKLRIEWFKDMMAPKSRD